MEFVEQLMSGMIRVDQLRQLLAQRGELIIIKQTNAGQIAVGVKEFDLFRRQTIDVPLDFAIKEFGDGRVLSRKIKHDHFRCVRTASGSDRIRKPVTESKRDMKTVSSKEPL